MHIVNEAPPIYDKILAAFPAARTCKPIFSWGDRIYNPHKVTIDVHLQVHEGVHGQRQGDAPEAWWDRYIADPQFRLIEELLAHAAEYRSRCEAAGVTRNQRRILLRLVAQRVASKLYGNLITVHDAKIVIAAPLHLSNPFAH